MNKNKAMTTEERSRLFIAFLSVLLIVNIIAQFGWMKVYARLDKQINEAMETIGMNNLEMPMLKSVYKVSNSDPKEFAVPGRNYLIIVNKDHKYDFDGDYNKSLQKDLVFVPNVVDGDVMAAEKATYLAFMLLQEDLRKNDGIIIGLYDGYRTAEDQQFLLDMYEKGDNPNITKGNDIGYSEHHTGLLLDVVIWYSEDGTNYDWYSPTEERLNNIQEFRTVYDKMGNYGFIERYPLGKESITGREAKEFEIRFVGSKEIAQEITKKGLCLEEMVTNK